MFGCWTAFPSSSWHSCGTNCTHLLADLSLYSYENEFIDILLKDGKKDRISERDSREDTLTKNEIWEVLTFMKWWFV